MKIYSAFKSQTDPKFSSPKQIAELLVNDINKDHVYSEEVSVADNGFIYFKICEKFIEGEISSILQNGLEYKVSESDKILVDFSSPNIAKEMHVGHLRSTIIGESICRILEFQGFYVDRINHLGDWGTQFGMLISHLEEEFPDFHNNMPNIQNLNIFYKQAKAKFESQPDFKLKSQKKVVDLQSGDENTLVAWKLLCDISQSYFELLYKRLDIKLNSKGESFYNSRIPNTVKECEEKGLIKLDQGAKCLFIEGKEVPLIVVKTDGGFNYDSTDLAAARYRLIEEKFKRIIICTDMGQFPHFDLIFRASQLAGWHTPPETRMDHMGFGVILGADGKKFRSSKGETYKLMDLLNEAKEQVKKDLQTRRDEKKEGQVTALETDEEIEEASEKIGMAAVRYYDLKQNRISDYKFEIEKMLDLKGNTAVYLNYAYVRLCSILRKCGLSEQEIINLNKSESYKITDPQERILAFLILRFPDIIDLVSEELAINRLCDYLYSVATKVSESYNKYRILNDPNTRMRIQLILVIKLLMEKIFYLVGIKPIEKIQIIQCNLIWTKILSIVLKKMKSWRCLKTRRKKGSKIKFPMKSVYKLKRTKIQIA